LSAFEFFFFYAFDSDVPWVIALDILMTMILSPSIFCLAIPSPTIYSLTGRLTSLLESQSLVSPMKSESLPKKNNTNQKNGAMRAYEM